MVHSSPKSCVWTVVATLLVLLVRCGTSETRSPVALCPCCIANVARRMSHHSWTALTILLGATSALCAPVLVLVAMLTVRASMWSLGALSIRAMLARLLFCLVLLSC